jgi:glycosyltransferase involved in cell wall biosynthesis
MNTIRDKPRILWVGNWRVEGGISVVTDRFMRDPIIRARFNVKVQDQSFPGKWNENIFLKYLKIPRGIFLILWNCLRFKPDIVHIHTPYQNGFFRDGIMAMLAKWCGKKVVLTFHPGNSLIEDYQCASPWLKPLTDFVLPRCDALIALGKSYQEFLIGLYHHPNIVVIPNPVDDEQVTKISRDYSQRESLVLFAGLLNERKGVFDFIKAIDKIPLNGVKYIIKGRTLTSRDEYILNQTFTECHSKGKIKIENWGPVYELLERACLVVLPSYGESLPIIIEEAIACGLPVIATPVGVIPDYLQDGIHGLLVKPGDIDGLAKAIEYVLTDKQWAAKVARSNREFGKIFLRSRVHSALMQVYERLLAD